MKVKELLKLFNKEGETMTSGAIWAIASLIGVIVGSGGFYLADRKLDQSETQEIQALSNQMSAFVEIMANMENDLAEGQKTVQVNMTEPDLLAVACSAEWMNKEGEDLCNIMYCRMAVRGLDGGASQGECAELNQMIIGKAVMKTCMPYWNEETATRGGIDQNSKFAQCKNLILGK